MTTELPADRVALLSHDELVRFVEQNTTTEDDTLNISNIVNWEDLSDAARDLLAEQLLPALQKPITPSLNADHLATLLAQIPSDESSLIHDTTNPHSSLSRSPTVDPPESATQEHETRCYDALLHDGCRPLFHISILPQVSTNPDAFHDLLRPWTRYPDTTHAEDWQVFSRQLRRWKEFRSWQLANRRQTVGFSEYLDEQRRDFEREGGPAEWTAQPDFEEVVRRQWEHEYGHGQAQQHHNDGGDDDDDAGAVFSKYTDAARRLLVDHGFVQPFQLQVDSKQQDPWTTCVEYFAFECFWLGRLAKLAKKQRLLHDAEWEGLVEAGVVRPLDTYDDLASAEVEAIRARELDRVARAARSFTAATGTTATDRVATYTATETLTQTTTKPRKRPRTRRDSRKPPSHAQKSLQPAQTRLGDIPRTEDLLDRYNHHKQKYQIAKAEADYQQRRVEWVRSEINKVKEEQDAVCRSGVSLGERRSTKRKRTSDDDVEPRAGKHRRTDGTETMAAGRDYSSRITRSTKRKLPTDDDAPEPQSETQETMAREADRPQTRSRKRQRGTQEKDGSSAPGGALQPSVGTAAVVSTCAGSTVTTKSRPRRQPIRTCRGTTSKR